MPKLPARQQDSREDRRFKAWTLHQQGWSQTQIAEALNVTQGAVSRWLKQVREGGSVEALRRHPAPGKSAKLTDSQFAQIPSLLTRGAEAFGFKGNHWTTKRVAEVLKQVFGVNYHPGHVSRLLGKHAPDWRNQNIGHDRSQPSTDKD